MSVTMKWFPLALALSLGTTAAVADEAWQQQEQVREQQAQQDLQRVQAIHEQFAMERQKRLDFKAQAEAKVAETKKLAIGAEIIQGTLERNAEIKVGDNMREVMNVEVLVEDDKVVAIRS